MNQRDTINVLVADGEEDCLSALSKLIEDEGAKPRVARSGRDVLGLLERDDFALIMLAIDLPGISGLTLAETLAGSPDTQTIPVILTTGAPLAPEAFLAAFDKGVVDILTKPIPPRVLKNKLHVYMERFCLNHRTGPTCQALCDRLAPKTFSQIVNRTIAELAGGIAHQFNNSLNIISGNVELLSMDQPDNPIVSQFSVVALEAVHRMAALTEKLLAYARVGGHQPDKVEFNDMVRKVLADSQIPTDRIRIESRLDPGLIRVAADSEHLKMVMAALLQNAVEAISETGTITVSTRYIARDDELRQTPGIGVRDLVCLDVADNGQGMSPETRARLFEPFFTTKFQGRGLDMAAVQGIVSNHEGVIDVESSPGKGTRVRIFLPVVGYRDAGDRGCVLVIDGDECLRIMTVTMLTRLGYQALAAATGQEAIETLKQEASCIDLVLLDIDMPGMSVKAFFSHLMTVFPGLKVVVSSGYSDEAPVDDLLSRGARAFLQKPFTFSDLAHLVQAQIERRQFKRYAVQDGFVVFPQGQETHKRSLIDISRGGASIPAIDALEIEELWRKLCLEGKGGAFRIKGIPFQFIASGPSYGGQARQAMRFGRVTVEQSRLIDEFIAQCAR